MTGKGSAYVRPVLAISSGGGHWEQLKRLREAWQSYPVVYASVNPESGDEVAPARFFIVPHANRRMKLALIRCCFSVAVIVLRTRPAVVVSTGAAPGYFGIAIGKIIGARTLWLDSIANVDRLSLAGRMVRPFADEWLTQWEHLSRPGGPDYHGSIL